MTAALCAWAQEPCPEVIPALQQWQGGKGRLSLPVSGEIVVDPKADARLASTARILADDLKALMKWDYAVRVGRPQGRCVYLTLSAPDSTLGSEGYVLTVDRRVTLSAPEAQGVFWATRTLCRCFAGSPMACPRARRVIIRAFPIADLCSMWAVSSLRWSICGSVSRYCPFIR